MLNTLLEAEKHHLADLLEAIQRCVYFLNASSQKLTWPLTAEQLKTQHKNIALFESLAAINERFAKLQDTLAAAMRHASLLAGEAHDSFLKVLSFYEKIGVLGSVAIWQLCRTARNLAAHDYEIEYTAIAEHFNTLHGLTPELYCTATLFINYCNMALKIEPAQGDFAQDFRIIVTNTDDKSLT